MKLKQEGAGGNCGSRNKCGYSGFILEVPLVGEGVTSHLFKEDFGPCSKSICIGVE